MIQRKKLTLMVIKVDVNFLLIFSRNGVQKLFTGKVKFRGRPQIFNFTINRFWKCIVKLHAKFLPYSQARCRRLDHIPNRAEKNLLA